MEEEFVHSDVYNRVMKKQAFRNKRDAVIRDTVISVILLFAVFALSMLCCGERDVYASEVTSEVQTESFTIEALQLIEPFDGEAAADFSESEEPENVLSFSPLEEDEILKMAMAEAEGEDVIGKALVIRVIVNRVEDPDFYGSVWGVLTDPGAFESYRNGRYDEAVPDEDCYAALALVESGWDESMGATYFIVSYANEGSWQSKNLKFLFQYGNHLFYR